MNRFNKCFAWTLIKEKATCLANIIGFEFIQHWAISGHQLDRLGSRYIPRIDNKRVQYECRHNINKYILWTHLFSVRLLCPTESVSVSRLLIETSLTLIFDEISIVDVLIFVERSVSLRFSASLSSLSVFSSFNVRCFSVLYDIPKPHRLPWRTEFI